MNIFQQIQELKYPAQFHSIYIQTFSVISDHLSDLQVKLFVIQDFSDSTKTISL